MQPEYGTSVRFTIENDLGTRVALDQEFHFAKVRFSTGETATASFSESQFSKLANAGGEIRAASLNPLFAKGPSSYNNSENIAFGERMDQRDLAHAMDVYNAQMLDYTQGRIKERPAFPDLATLSHWQNDFKLRGAGDPVLSSDVTHLYIDPRDLKLSHAPNPNESHPWKRQSEFAQAVSVFRDINKEYKQGVAAIEDTTGRRATVFDKTLAFSLAAALTLGRKIHGDFRAFPKAMEPAAPRLASRAKRFDIA